MKKWVVALVLGLVMLFFSTGLANDDSNSVKCGTEIMGPGDVCEETRNGTTIDTRTYEDMKQSKESSKRAFDTWLRWVLLGGGLVLTGFSIAGIRRHKRRAAATQEPAAVVQQPHPGPGQPGAQYPQGMAPPPNYPPQQQQQQPYTPQQQPYQGQQQQPYPPQQSQPLPQQQYPPQGWGPSGPQN